MAAQDKNKKPFLSEYLDVRYRRFFKKHKTTFPDSNKKAKELVSRHGFMEAHRISRTNSVKFFGQEPNLTLNDHYKYWLAVRNRIFNLASDDEKNKLRIHQTKV